MLKLNMKTRAETLFLFFIVIFNKFLYKSDIKQLFQIPGKSLYHLVKKISFF